MRVRIAPLVLCVGLAACAAPQHQVASLPPPPPAGEPSGVAGLTAHEVRVTYGTPDFVRKDRSTEMWRYDGQACRAFFFLYASGADETVRHVETLPRGATMAADQACLDGFKMRAQSKVS
jgi:hypothetical protein